MSRYIDADALLALYKGDVLTAQTDYAEGIRDVIQDIKDAPSIDIVRCGECIHCADDWNENQPMFTCELGECGESVRPNDFCAYGEARRKQMLTDRMPKTCGECFANNDDYCCNLTGEVIVGISGKRADCPLVEIVRCKECKHCDPEDKKCDCGHDIMWQLPRTDEWFCADGEKKEVRKDEGADDE